MKKKLIIAGIIFLAITIIAIALNPSAFKQNFDKNFENSREALGAD